MLKGELRTTDLIIKDIKKLVKKRGYIYALCMIIFNDFRIVVEELHKINTRSKLSIQEVSLLIGFLVQNKIDFSIPEESQDVFKLKQNTYDLLSELHESFMIPFFEKLKASSEKEHKIEDYRKEQKEFFGKGDMLKEAIFYSGSGVYDFQYLDFLERKYKYCYPN
jgi:hypothetical protein